MNGMKLFVVLALISPASVLGMSAKKAELIREFLKLSHATDTLEGLRRRNVELFRKQLEQQATSDTRNDPRLVKRYIDRVLKKYEDYSHEIFAVEKWERRYSEMYDELLSEEQLTKVVEFVQTDAGQAFLKLAPAAAARAQAALGQALDPNGKDENPIDKIMREAAKELDAESDGK